jgi:hypothetical protein
VPIGREVVQRLKLTGHARLAELNYCDPNGRLWAITPVKRAYISRSTWLYRRLGDVLRPD